MALNEAFYSTADSINDSIQDKIDSEKLEIKELTKIKLNNLKVDILNSGSHLNIRDENLNDIGNLGDNSNLTYLNEYKKDSNGKVFLKVKDNKSGKVGFVSADYVKGEVSGQTNAEPIQTSGKDEVVKSTTKPNPIKKPKDDDEIETNSKDDENNIENNEAELVSVDDQVASLRKKYLSFQDTIKSIDTITDTQTSKEKQENADFLKTNLQSLLKDISNLENNYVLTPKIKNIINEVKLYLAKYFADEGEIENSNFTNYQLSNRLAFEVLGNIKGVKEAPKAPDRGEVISKIKGTGTGEYITAKINEGEELSKIFSNDTVKGKMEEVGEELVEKYEEDLEVYLEDIDENHSSSLNKSQKQALNLLMDVNGAGWSVKNSTTDMIDVMSWDFASIGAGIGAGFGTGALLGSWTGAGALVTGAAGALVGGATSTLGMMANHGDNYFNSDDYGKGLTEFTINSAMFGAGGAAFKGAKMIQGTNSILSKQGLAAMGVEASADVTIGVMSDMTRGWAYGMNIELTDAITNNLVWALLPIALRGKQVFSAARKKLAKEATDTQQKASILSRLGDKTGAKKLIDGFSNKIEGLRKKETGVKKESKNKPNDNNIISNNNGALNLRLSELKNGEVVLIKTERGTLKVKKIEDGKFKIEGESVKTGIEKILNNKTGELNINKDGKVILKTEGKEIYGGTIKTNGPKVNNGNENTKNRPKFDKETINRNRLLDDIDRILETEKLLSIKLKPEQKKALINAHNVDINNIKEKIKILRGEKGKTLFNKTQREKILRSGLAGKKIDLENSLTIKEATLNRNQILIDKNTLKIKDKKVDLETKNKEISDINLSIDDAIKNAQSQTFNIVKIKNIESDLLKVMKKYKGKENNNIKPKDIQKYNMNISIHSKNIDIINKLKEELKVAKEMQATKKLYKIKKGLEIDKQKLSDELVNLENIGNGHNINKVKIENEINDIKNDILDNKQDIQEKWDNRKKNIEKKENRRKETQERWDNRKKNRNEKKEWVLLENDINKSIKNDINSLKVGENLEYPNNIKISRISDSEYKIGDTKFTKIDYLVKATKEELGNKYYKLIENGGHKELKLIRQKLVDKEFSNLESTFKLDNNYTLLKKETNGGFKKVNIDDLTQKEQRLVSKTLLGEKGNNAYTRSIENLSSSGKKIGSIFNGNFWKELKAKNPSSVKTIEWLYNQSIGSYIGELIKSGKADGFKKAYLGRTLLTGKHSEEFFGKFMVGAWLPSTGNMAGIAGLSTIEYLTGHFNEKDFLGNYAEIIILGWLGTALLETPTVFDTGKGFIGVAGDAYDSAERN